MVNPHGNTMFNLGEGTERQAVANALYNIKTNNTVAIND